MHPRSSSQRLQFTLPAILLATMVTASSCRTASPASTPTPGARPTGAPGTPTGAQAPGGGAPGPGAGTPGDPVPRPYASVITSRATSRDGVFRVHQVGSRLYFEIPRAEMGKDFVVVTSLAGTAVPIPLYGAFGGQEQIRFERRDNRVYLRQANLNNTVSDTSRITDLAMSMVNLSPIMATLNVEAYGPDSAAVVEVTRLFTGAVPQFTANTRRANVDATRSYIDKFSVFDKNVNLVAVQTFTLQPSPGAPPPTAQTEAYAFSIVKLPEQPMAPRLHDARVGFFSTSLLDFGSTEQRVHPRSYITRWRLECSEQRIGNLCVPRKPITYYIDPATPQWLIPFIRRGVEAWKPAFEAAGFHNGIVAADAPRDQPDFSGDDASVSMVRWLASPVNNAVGPSIVDPRTGEIIDADVQMHHNITNIFNQLYFAQVAHLDPRARRFPYPEDLAGSLVEYVVAHEVGHTLGFPHNMKASSMYPIDSLRSRSWLQRMGHIPSVMDYARFNYLVQPGDNIPAELLMPRIGPYDHFAVRWGYSPIPGAQRPEDERRTLDSWARMQDTVPWFRFASDAGAGGPDFGEQTEAVGDADAVRATRLGFQSIRQVMPLIEAAGSGEPTADATIARNLYTMVVNQWATEAGHVARIIGSLQKQEKMTGQDGPVYTPVPRARQREAMQFLVDEVFPTPQYLIDATLLRRIESDGAINRIVNAQNGVLNSVLNNTRLSRMIEHQALSRGAGDHYPVTEMLTDLRRGLWSEIYDGKAVDAYRRRLQTLYLEALATKINPPPPQTLAPGFVVGGAAATRDVRPVLKDELRVLDRELTRAIARTSDRLTRAHLQDARDRIEVILDPR